jgi:hypothetical protein
MKAFACFCLGVDFIIPGVSFSFCMTDLVRLLQFVHFDELITLTRLHSLGALFS